MSMLQQKTYTANHDGPHAFATEGPNAPKWYIVDAKDQVVGRLATTLARVITGKHKPTYTKHADVGDFVVVINADKINFTRNKWDDKKYYRHSGYISGLHVRTAKEQLEHEPTEILRRAVWGMTNKSILADRQIKKMKLIVGDKHPHGAQNPQPLPAHVIRKTGLDPKVLAKNLKKA
ncbi:MAG: 50S ribosomal protein L13 [Bacteriovoracia bacterium]